MSQTKRQIGLSFNLDTSMARMQLANLYTQLNSINKLGQNFGRNGNFGLTNEIMRAVQASTQLERTLGEAINPLTKNLDLTKFNNQLRMSGANLDTFKDAFMGLGVEGAATFNDLTKSIAMAETPLLQTSKAASQLWQVMGNTMRWQATSSMIHGVMSTAASAMSYVKNLDSSLNSIQIVTGQTADQMSRFAVQANEAAKALNTTTNQYAKASLIYYQQGLSNKQVEERTATTIKLANVSGQSAKKVSDQLTAVWNNFYDGTKSLEYYADVMTALGASTASSSEEIAKGLSKFSSIAQTTGLSYEYATSALSTVVAATRQSADAVGTTFKTLFSRLQGLNLGETLDDGVTLNKYSKALNTIGVNILNANGSLKDMDSILDELGSKWQNLTDAQQVALAQTIGGVRSYTGLMSLMDNWGDFQKNLITAQNAQGTLQAQADIYAQSWEAASAHVRAASETIYSNLLNDNLIKGITNGFGSILDVVGHVTNSLGGFGGTMMSLASIGSKVFEPQLTKAFDNIAYSIGGRNQAIELQERAIEDLLKPVQVSPYASVNTMQQNVNKNLHDNLIAYRQGVANGKIDEYSQPAFQQLMNVVDAAGKNAIQAAQTQTTNTIDREFDQLMNSSKLNIAFNSNIKNGVFAQQEKLAEERYNNLLNKQGSEAVATQIAKDNLQRWQNFNANYMSENGLKNDINQFQKDITTINSSQASLMAIKDTFSTGGKETDAAQLQNMANMAKTLVEGAGKDLNKLATNLGNQDVAKAIMNVYDNTKSEKNIALQNKEQIAKIVENINLANNGNTVESLISSAIEGNQKTYEQKVTEFTEKATMAFGGGDKGKQEAQSFIRDLERASSIGSTDKIKELLTKGDYEGARKELQTQLEAKNNSQQVVSAGKALTSITGSIASVGTTLMSLNRTISVFRDETSTVQQKASSIVTTFGTLPMTISSLSSLTTSWGAKIGATGITVGGLAKGIGVAAAGAVALGVAIDNYNKGTQKTALENFTAAMSTSAQMATEAQQKYEQLPAIQQSYNNLVNAYNQATVGTLEQTRSLLAVNEAANNIIEEYGLEYGKDYSYGAGSQIIINGQSFENAKKEAEKQAQDAAYNQTYIRAMQQLVDANYHSPTEQLNQEVEEKLNKEIKNTYTIPGFFWTEKEREITDQYKIQNILEDYISQNFGKEIDNAQSLSDFLKTSYGEQVLSQFQNTFKTLNTDTIGQQLLEAVSSNGVVVNGTLNDNAVWNEVLSEIPSQNKLRQQAAAEEIVATIGQQIAQEGTATDLAVAMATANSEQNIENWLKIGQIASNASESTTGEILGSWLNIAGYATEKDYYKMLTHKTNLEGISQDEIRSTVLGEIVRIAGAQGGEGIKKIVGKELWENTFKEVFEGFKGFNDYFAEAEKLNIPSQLNSFKNLKLGTLNEELSKLTERASGLREQADELVYSQGFYPDSIAVTQLRDQAAALDNYVENLTKQEEQITSMVQQSIGWALSGTSIFEGEKDALTAFDAIKNEYSIHELSSIGNYLTNARGFYGAQTAETMYNLFAGPNGSNIFKELGKVNWDTSLSGLASLGKLAASAGEGINTFRELLDSAIKDVGGEGGIFNKLYNSSGFSKVLDKLETSYRINGSITTSDISKYAEKSEELYSFLQIGANTSDALAMNSAGLASTLNAIYDGIITADQVNSDIVRAFSIAGQREANEAEAFEYVDNQDLGRSGGDIMKFFQGWGKAVYSAQVNNLAMDDPLMAVMNYMPANVQQAYYESMKNGPGKTYYDLIRNNPTLDTFDNLTQLLMGRKGKGGGTIKDVISAYGEMMKDVNSKITIGEELGSRWNKEFAQSLGLEWEKTYNIADFTDALGFLFSSNNIELYGNKAGVEGKLGSEWLKTGMEEAFTALLGGNKEEAKALASIFLEDIHNSSSSYQVKQIDTQEAIEDLRNSNKSGQTFSDGGTGGAHFYNRATLEAIYSQSKGYLQDTEYGETLDEFIDHVLGEDGLLLSTETTELFTDKLSEGTIQKLYDLQNEENGGKFSDLSSLLYQYGAIYSDESGKKVLDSGRWMDFIAATGGSVQTAQDLLGYMGGEDFFKNSWVTQDGSGFSVGTSFTDKYGHTYGLTQNTGESYADLITRANSLQASIAAGAITVIDDLANYNPKEEGQARQVTDLNGFEAARLQGQGYKWTQVDLGLGFKSWVLAKEGNETSPVNPSEWGDTYTPTSDTTTVPDTSSGGGGEGGTSDTGGETSTPATTTSTYTGPTPPRGPYSNWSTDAERNAALTEFGGYDAASAKAQEAGFNGDMTGIMDYYAYTHPGELSNWVLSPDQIAFAKRTEVKQQAAVMKATAEITAGGSARITQWAAKQQAAAMKARAEANASEAARITESAKTRALAAANQADADLEYQADLVRMQNYIANNADAYDAWINSGHSGNFLDFQNWQKQEQERVKNETEKSKQIEEARTAANEMAAEMAAEDNELAKFLKDQENEREANAIAQMVQDLVDQGYYESTAWLIAEGKVTKEEVDKAAAVTAAREEARKAEEEAEREKAEMEAAAIEAERKAQEEFEAEEARKAEEARQAEEAAHEQTAKEFADYNDIDIEAARAALAENGWEWSAAQGTLPPPENNLENEEPVVIQPESVVVEQPPEEQTIQPEVSELTAADRLQALGWTDKQIGLFPGSPEDVYDLVMGLNGEELNEQAYSDLRSQFSEQDLENYMDQFGLETGDWVGLQAALNKVQNSLDEQTEALQNVDENTEQVADAYENENGTTMSEEERQNQEEEKTEDEAFKDTNLPEREPEPASATSPTSDFTNTSEGGGTDTNGGGAADTGGGGGGTTGGATDNDVAVSANNASSSWGEAVTAIGGAIGAIADAVGAIFGKATGQNNTRILQFASGKEGHMAVTGELGPELTIREDGSVDMLGQHGREYAWVNPDDIIYTAAQTASIMGNNNIKWLNGFAKGFNNKIRGYETGYTGQFHDEGALTGSTDNPGGVNSGGGVGEAVRRGAYSGTYGGMMAATETLEEEQDPRYDPNTLKERDIVTRYFTVLQQLDDITREIEHFGKAADRAWGEEKLQAIDRQTEAYKEQFSYYQKYMGQIENYLKSDQDALTLMIKEFARDFKEKTGVEIFGGSTSQSQQRQNPDEGSHVYGLTQYGGNPTPSRAIGQNNNIIAFADGTLEQEEKKRLEQQLEENRARRTEQMSMSNSFYKEQQIDLMTGMMPQDTFAQQDTSGQDAALLRDPINWISAEYDLNGVLTNYQEIVERMIQVYNENAEAFAQDKEAQYKFQEMLKDIQFYTDSLNLYESQKEVLNDLKNAILDNQIRRIVYQISYENELDNNALKEINYNFEKIRDNAYRSADAIDYYATKMEYLDKSNERYKEGIKDILATYSGNITNGIQNQIMLSFYRKAPMKGYDIPDQETPGLDQLGMRYDEFGMPIYDWSEGLRNPMDGIHNFYKDIYTENYETTRGAVEAATTQVISNIGKNTAGIIQQQSDVATETIAKVAENTANDIGRATFSEINRIDDTITGVDSYFNSRPWMEDYRYDFMNGVFSSNKEEEKEEENTSTLVTKNGVTTDTAKRKRYKGTPPNKDGITPPRQMDYLDGTFSGRRFMNSNLVYGEGMFGPENSPTLMGQPVDEYTELPYFPTDQEVEEYFKNFTAVQIGEETYYVPKSADIEIRDDMVQPIDITRAIVNNKGQLTKDEKDLITAQVKAWYDELTKVAPELAANIKPIYQDGFMTNFREVLNAINDANAQMSDYMYDLLINDTEEFFKRWSEITVNNADFQDITTETAAQLENMIDIIYANLQQKEKYIDTIISTLGNDIKTFNKELNAQIDEFDFYNEILSDYESIINLTNKRSTNIGNSFMSNLRDALLDNAINKVSGTKTTYDTMRQMYNGAKETYDLAKEEFENYRNELLKNMTAEEAAQDQHYQYLEDRLDQVQDEMDIANSKLEDSNKQFLKAWEDALSKIQSDYTEAVQDAAKTLEESFSPLFNTFDLLQAEFERQKNLEDYYLDDYQRIHDLNALDRSIEQSILDTDNLKSKARLRDMQKEINDLMDEGTELSAYDLDILQKKYDIELARQALEDAKEAKSVVRLSRDNNGNWSYIYTSDDQEIEEAEQNYENAIRDMEEANENYIDNLEAQIIQVQQTAEQAILSLSPEDFATYDEYLAAVAAIQQNMYTTLDYLREQLNHAFGNNEWLDPVIVNRYGKNDHNLTDGWDKMTLAAVSGINSLDDAVGTAKDNLQDMIGSSLEAFEEYSKKQSEVYATAGADIKQASEYFNLYVNETLEESNQRVETTENLANRVGDAFAKTAEKVRDFNKDIFDLTAEYEKLNSVMIKFLEISGEYVPEEKLDFVTAIDTYKEIDEIKQVLGKYGKILVTDYDEKGNRRIYNLEENTETTAKQFEEWYELAAKNDEFDVGDDLDEKEEYEKINNYLEEHGQVYVSIDGELKKLSKNNEEDMAWLKEKLDAIEKEEDLLNRQSMFGDPFGMGLSGAYPDYMGNAEIYDSSFGREERTVNINWNENEYQSSRNIDQLRNAFEGVYGDTGLYTGEWSGGSEHNNGRLAWLHQKELVLNEQDTENFLNAINIVRQLDNLTSWMANGLGDLFTPNIKTGENVLEQNVHIDASFPNVSDHNEIEEAFGNLVNLASQYANRKSFT